MEWLAPVAALVGVVVGGVLNAGLSAEFERRRELAAGAVAARFVSEEWELIADTAAAAVRAGRWGPVLDPGLPYSRGLWAVEHRGGERESSAWLTHSGELARCLTSSEWEAVTRPYQTIREVSLRFWTDDPNRPLDGDATAFLNKLSASIRPALVALAPVARGERKTRLQRLTFGGVFVRG